MANYLGIQAPKQPAARCASENRVIFSQHVPAFRGPIAENIDVPALPREMVIQQAAASMENAR